MIIEYVFSPGSPRHGALVIDMPLTPEMRRSLLEAALAFRGVRLHFGRNSISYRLHQAADAGDEAHIKLRDRLVDALSQHYPRNEMIIRGA